MHVSDLEEPYKPSVEKSVDSTQDKHFDRLSAKILYHISRPRNIFIS